MQKLLVSVVLVLLLSAVGCDSSGDNIQGADTTDQIQSDGQSAKSPTPVEDPGKGEGDPDDIAGGDNKGGGGE